MNTVCEMAVTYRPVLRLGVSRDALRGIDTLARPNGVTVGRVLGLLHHLVKAGEQPPWAVILWPRDCRVSGELAGLRYTKRNVVLSSYAGLRGDVPPGTPAPPTSILVVRRKAILEDVVRRSSLLASAWALLKDGSPRRTWLCLCAGPAYDGTAAGLQADAARFAAAMAKAPQVQIRRHAWMQTPGIEFETELLVAALDKGCYALAAEISRRFCELAPDDPYLWHGLGFALCRKGDAEGAAAAYSRALDLVPNWLEPRWGLVQARWAGRLHEAGAELDALLEVDPFDERFLKPRMASYAGPEGAKPEHYARAEALLRRYLALWPDCGCAWARLGTLLCQQGSFEEAIPMLRRSVILSPQFAYSWNNLAFAQAMLGINLPAAEYACQRSLALDPATYSAWDTLGVIAMKRHRYADARAAFLTALKLKPTAADTQANLAEAERALSRSPYAGRPDERAVPFGALSEAEG